MAKMLRKAEKRLRLQDGGRKRSCAFTSKNSESLQKVVVHIQRLKMKITFWLQRSVTLNTVGLFQTDKNNILKNYINPKS